MKALAMNCLRTGAMALALSALCLPAQAAYTITISESGTDVVADGSGSLDLTALGAPTQSNVGIPAMVGPIWGIVFVGPAGGQLAQAYSGNSSISGPNGIGSGLSQVNANSGSGSVAGMNAASTPTVYVPQGYVSGTHMTGSARWNGTTFVGLGLSPGTYTWTWGSGATADSFTVIVQGAAPAPQASSSSGALAFGNQTVATTSAAQMLTITNTGTAALLINAGGVTLAGTHPGDFAISADTCSGAGLAPSATCSVNVTFTPAAVGARAAQLVFASNDPTSPLSVPLSGTGVAAAGPTPGGATSIPTVSEWGLMLMSLILAGLAATGLRRSTDRTNKE